DRIAGTPAARAADKPVPRPFMDSLELWWLLLKGYLSSIAVETPVLLLGLSPRHPLRRRLFCGVWLTACTYPVVILVLPPLFGLQEAGGVSRPVGGTLAPAAEGPLFRGAFGGRPQRWRPSMGRDRGAIVLANLASFAAGEVFYAWEENARPAVAPAGGSGTI